MKQKLPITDVKEAVIAAFKLGGALKAAGADGKWEFGDVTHLIPVFPHMGKAFDGGSEIPAQLADLDAQESDELQALIASELGAVIGSPQLIAQINAALKLLKAGHDLYASFKEESQA